MWVVFSKAVAEFAALDYGNRPEAVIQEAVIKRLAKERTDFASPSRPLDF